MTAHGVACEGVDMSELDKIISRIREPIATGKLSKRELARRAGIRDTVLIGMEAGDWNPRRSTIDALLRAVKSRPLGNGANQASVPLARRRRAETRPAA